jgi:hypothetical protein
MHLKFLGATTVRKLADFGIVLEKNWLLLVDFFYPTTSISYHVIEFNSKLYV